MDDQRSLETGETEVKPTEDVPVVGDGGSEDGETKDQLIAKLTEERDNYRKGLLAEKSRDRSLSAKDEPKRVAPTEAAVERALAKAAEREAIAEILDPTSPHHIPECVDADSWRQIVGYVPSGADKSTRMGIRKALRLATEMWKLDTGRRAVEPNKSAADAAAMSGTQSPSGESAKPKPKGVPIQKRTSIDDWFKK